MASVLLAMVEFFSRKRTYSSHHLFSHAWHVPVMHDHHPIMGVIGFAFFHPWHKLFCSSQFFIVNGFTFFAEGDKLFCSSQFFIVNGFAFFAGGDKLFYKTINTSHQYWFFSDSLLLISQHGILLSRNWLILGDSHFALWEGGGFSFCPMAKKWSFYKDRV